MGVADRAREELRPARRNDDAAADTFDDLSRLALRIRGRDDGAADGENPVEAAGHDVTRETGRESDHVHVGCGERLGEPLPRLVEEETDLVDLEQIRERDKLGMSRAHADNRDRELVEITEKCPRPHERIEVLGVSDVSRVHDDELAFELGDADPFVLFAVRSKPCRVDPIR